MWQEVMMKWFQTMHCRQWLNLLVFFQCPLFFIFVISHLFAHCITNKYFLKRFLPVWLSVRHRLLAEECSEPFKRQESKLQEDKNASITSIIKWRVKLSIAIILRKGGASAAPSSGGSIDWTRPRDTCNIYKRGQLFRGLTEQRETVPGLLALLKGSRALSAPSVEPSMFL